MNRAYDERSTVTTASMSGCIVTTRDLKYKHKRRVCALLWSEVAKKGKKTPKQLEHVPNRVHKWESSYAGWVWVRISTIKSIRKISILLNMDWIMFRAIVFALLM